MAPEVKPQPQPFDPQGSLAFPSIAAQGVTPLEELPENFRAMRSDAATLREIDPAVMQQFITDEESGNLNQRGVESSFVTAFPNVARSLEDQAVEKARRRADAMARGHTIPNTDDPWERYQSQFQRTQDLENVRRVLGVPVEQAVHAIQSIQADHVLEGIGSGIMRGLDFIQEVKEEFIFGSLKGQPGVRTPYRS